MNKRCKGCGCPVFGYDSRCFECFKAMTWRNLEDKIVTPKAIERKNGDIWEMNAAIAPFNSKQWGYQGTAKVPYVVTLYAAKRDGAVTGDGWACSCPDFCKHSPRAHCKHIMRILHKMGKVPTTAAVIAGATDKELADFKAWQRAKAEAKPAVGQVNITTIVEGRKFR